MKVTIYNFLKQRLKTIDLQISEENTTWFDGDAYDPDIEKITDFKGGLLISPPRIRVSALDRRKLTSCP